MSAKDQAAVADFKYRLLNETGALTRLTPLDSLVALAAQPRRTTVLDQFQRSMLVAVDRITAANYDYTDGQAVLDEMAALGIAKRPDHVVLNCAKDLKRNGYLEATFPGSHDFKDTALMSLTEDGRHEARTADPFERTYRDTRGALASDEFARAYPKAYKLWADAEDLLNSDDAEDHLTAIGHKVREAMQGFATAMVNTHQPPDVDDDVAHARARLGAVIALYRPQLGKRRRIALETLGNLWEANDELVQRQEHGAQKEGDAITWTDARRIVWLTMFLMVEFSVTLEDLGPG